MSNFANWIHEKLGDDFGGSPCPPGSIASMEFGPEDEGKSMYVASTGNDGFELWVGYHHKWLFHCDEKHARELAWFVFYEWWAKATWFGLKRKIWYWELHKRVERYKQGQN